MRKKMKKQHKVFSIDKNMQILTEVDAHVGTPWDLVTMLVLSVSVLHMILSKRSNSSFGGLVVSMLASGNHGFKTWLKLLDFSGEKILQRESKAVCPMSQLCSMQKNPTMTWKSLLLG
jgi:hypothetical protein